MWREIAEDFNIHGRSLKNGAFWALAVFRFGRWALERRFPPWRWFCSKVYGCLKIVSEVTTGVMLDRRTKVGKGLHIIHSGMISIHPDVVLGDRVGIMHNVTLGTNMGTDVPQIGSDVFIGCGASILGKVKVGAGARIAANSLVISDVPPGSVAIGVPARMLPSDLSALRQKPAPETMTPGQLLSSLEGGKASSSSGSN